jgi:hypothetical protein
MLPAMDWSFTSAGLDALQAAYDTLTRTRGGGPLIDRTRRDLGVILAGSRADLPAQLLADGIQPPQTSASPARPRVTRASVRLLLADDRTLRYDIGQPRDVSISSDLHHAGLDLVIGEPAEIPRVFPVQIAFAFALRSFAAAPWLSITPP